MIWKQIPKAQNQKLLDFLCRQQCMEELVNLITQDPPQDMEEKVRFKYVLRLLARLWLVSQDSWSQAITS